MVVTRTTRNRFVGDEPARGFESHALRHNLSENSFCMRVFGLFWLYVNSWGKKTQKMKRSKGSGRKVAALNYENICKMRFLNLLKLEYP